MKRLALLACLVAAVVAQQYDPCDWANSQGAKAKKQGFTVGLAFWPNGLLTDWADLHPCNNRTLLAAYGVYVASFIVKVDSMTAMHLNDDQLDTVMETYKYTYAYNYLQDTRNASFMSVVAFHGNGASAVVSAPRYMRSTNRTLTTGAGRASQLFLIIRLSAGNAKYLQWFSLGCGDCGVATDLCMQVGGGDTTCGQSETTCASNNAGFTVDPTVVRTDLIALANRTAPPVTYVAVNASQAPPCTFAVYSAFSGTDSYGRPLKTGQQVENLRSYSITALAKTTSAFAKAQASYIKNQFSTVDTGGGGTIGRG